MMDERRLAPRIDHKIPVVVRQRRRVFRVQTKNLSATGAYCTFPSFVPPMTKLKVRLRLDMGTQKQTITGHGVVVRVNPPSFRRQCSAYHVAIFFSDLSNEDRTTVARYVLRHLQLAPSRE